MVTVLTSRLNNLSVNYLGHPDLVKTPGIGPLGGRGQVGEPLSSPLQGLPDASHQQPLPTIVSLDHERGQIEQIPSTPLGKENQMPDKRPSVKNEKQYEALKDKGMSKQRAARIANSPGASSRGGKKSGSGGSSKQGGTTAQKKAAGRKGGTAAARKRS
jgi:hypothetical protein